jgi:hypothetical protein
MSSWAGTFNRRTRASSGPSGDGPSGLCGYPEGSCPQGPEPLTERRVRVPTRQETGPPGTSTPNLKYSGPGETAVR